MDAENWKEWIGGIGRNYATSIKDAGIKYVVNLSSIGAHMPDARTCKWFASCRSGVKCAYSM